MEGSGARQIAFSPQNLLRGIGFFFEPLPKTLLRTILMAGRLTKKPAEHLQQGIPAFPRRFGR